MDQLRFCFGLQQGSKKSVPFTLARSTHSRQVCRRSCLIANLPQPRSCVFVLHCRATIFSCMDEEDQRFWTAAIAEQLLQAEPCRLKHSLCSFRRVSLCCRRSVSPDDAFVSLTTAFLPGLFGLCVCSFRLFIGTRAASRLSPSASVSRLVAEDAAGWMWKPAANGYGWKHRFCALVRPGSSGESWVLRYFKEFVADPADKKGQGSIKTEVRRPIVATVPCWWLQRRSPV